MSEFEIRCVALAEASSWAGVWLVYWGRMPGYARLVVHGWQRPKDGER